MMKKCKWVLFSEKLPVDPHKKPSDPEEVIVAENYKNLKNGQYSYVVLDAYNVSLEYSNYPEYRKIYIAWMKFDKFEEGSID